LERAETREFRDLKKQISKLKAEVRQLRKTIKEYERLDVDIDYRGELDLEVKCLENTIVEANLKKTKDKNVQKCPHCGSKDECMFFEVVGRPYYKCDFCETKGFLDKTT
jgi:uncharacterized protein YdcH (DUF465 family)